MRGRFLHRLDGAQGWVVLGEQVTAQGARQFGRMKQEQVSLYTRFLAVLGGVALLVGSLGITNVMLVSVAETPLAAELLALLSGLVAGAYPALRAARLDPVKALQGG